MLFPRQRPRAGELRAWRSPLEGTNLSERGNVIDELSRASTMPVRRIGARLNTRWPLAILTIRPDGGWDRGGRSVTADRHNGEGRLGSG